MSVVPKELRSYSIFVYPGPTNHIFNAPIPNPESRKGDWRLASWLLCHSNKRMLGDSDNKEPSKTEVYSILLGCQLPHIKLPP